MHTAPPRRGGVLSDCLNLAKLFPHEPNTEPPRFFGRAAFMTLTLRLLRFYFYLFVLPWSLAVVKLAKTMAEM